MMHHAGALADTSESNKYPRPQFVEHGGKLAFQLFPNLLREVFTGKSNIQDCPHGS